VSFVGSVTASPGTLLALRDQLKFIKKGKEILEMKRDRLAGEINKLLAEVKIREDAEKRLMDTYKLLVEVLMRKGIRDLATFGKSVKPVRLRFGTTMVMGVNMVDVSIEEVPNIDSIYDPLVQGLARKLYECFEMVIKTAVIENNIESLANELMSTSRKVNSLEKTVIPEYENLIRYVEERLLEDALENFVRTKHIVSKKG
jgi:V/A-type H+-transporting ATPase subunit D